MTNKQLLKEIHRDNEAINRSLQHLINIGLIGLLGRSAEEAKKTNDSVGKTLWKKNNFGRKQKSVIEGIALK